MKKFLDGIGSLIKHPVGIIIATSVLWHGVIWVAKIPINYIVSVVLLIIDCFVAFYLLDRLIYFFSQFVLPIQNPKHRQEIYTRVNNFETGTRGPAFFIKNGRIIMHKGEAEKRGMGVMVLDTASAAVLRTDTEIKDTAGPGVKFISDKEYIAGSVDLRAQWQFIGPLATDRPFDNPVPGNPKEFNEVQNRRLQTSGLTRDGFEVCPRISIKFSVKRPAKKLPTESGVISQYGFDEFSARNAITREVLELNSDNSKARMEWNKLPAHLVVNVWREYIRKFKLDELFTSNGESGLHIIEERINRRVKKLRFEGMDETGKDNNIWQESLEYKQLQSRGLEITDVRIHNVFFDADIEKQNIERWSTEWLKLAKKDEQALKEKETLIETVAREEASKRFAITASKPFSGKLTAPQNSFKTLQLLIQPLREFILSESAPGSDMEKELPKLDEIWKWLLDNSVNIDVPSNGHSGDEP